DAPAQAGEGDGAVHGAGVEVLQAEALGERPGHGGLPRSRRTVDGDDPHERSTLPVAPPPARSRSRNAQNPGKVLATHPGSAIRIPGARRPARANAIAIRWSS